MNAIRKIRGISQKLYLIESKSPLDYVVMGSTGNVYDVKIESIPKCTCPDHLTKNNRCKHIYFILIKIMGVVDVDKNFFTEEEISEMCKNIPNIPNKLYVDNELKNKYNSKINNKTNNKIIIRGLDDMCPICLDDINNGEPYEYCKSECGRCIHTECFNLWSKKNNTNCLFCKKKWYGESQYINLS